MRSGRCHIRLCMMQSVPRHDLRRAGEQFRLGRIDGDMDPVRIRPAEGLDPREILEQAIRLLAEERLVDAEDVGIAMQESHGPVVAFQFFRQRLQAEVIGRILTNVPTVFAVPRGAEVRTLLNPPPRRRAPEPPPTR